MLEFNASDSRHVVGFPELSAIESHSTHDLVIFRAGSGHLQRNDTPRCPIPPSRIGQRA